MKISNSKVGDLFIFKGNAYFFTFFRDKNGRHIIPEPKISIGETILIIETTRHSSMIVKQKIYKVKVLYDKKIFYLYRSDLSNFEKI